MAIPIHGGDRTRHLLIALGGAICWCVTGCAPNEGEPPGAAAEPDLSAAAAPLVGALVAQRSSDGASAVPATGDAGTPSTLRPFDSRSWYVLLVDANGSLRALRQRFDRLSLRDGTEREGSDDQTGDAASSWRFDTVMMASGAQARRGAASADDAAIERRDWQQVQRQALGLATSDQMDGIDGAAEQGMTLGVLTHHLEFLPGGSVCQGRYRLSGVGTGSIEAQQRRCPIDSSAAGTAFTRSDGWPMPARDDSGAVGVAWQRRLQGGVPDAQAAVRFDLATLTLRGLGTLELLRSRRSSGRGVPVVTARRLGPEGWQPIRDVEWTEPGDGAAERVRIDSLEVSLTLSRLALPGQTGPLPDPVAWRGMVFARGSHDGAGFAELAPRGGSDDAS